MESKKTLEERLQSEYLKRERLYKKGLNDEKLNDKIRELQRLIKDN